MILFILYHKQARNFLFFIFEYWQASNLKILSFEKYLIPRPRAQKIYKNVCRREQRGPHNKSVLPNRVANLLLLLKRQSPLSANTGRFARIKFLTRGGSTDNFHDIRRLDLNYPSFHPLVCLRRGWIIANELVV